MRDEFHLTRQTGSPQPTPTDNEPDQQPVAIDHTPLHIYIPRYGYEMKSRAQLEVWLQALLADNSPGPAALHTVRCGPWRTYLPR